MSRNVEELWSPACVVFGKVDGLTGSLRVNRVDFDSQLEVTRQGNDLNVISIDIQLFNFARAEARNVSTDEVLVQDSILL